jgi:hypothetical protein
MGPQNHRDGKYRDAMNKDFRGLLDNMQDTTHHLEIYDGTQEHIKRESSNKTYLSDEQLHTMELCIYHDIDFQAEGFKGERR